MSSESETNDARRRAGWLPADVEDLEVWLDAMKEADGFSGDVDLDALVASAD